MDNFDLLNYLNDDNLIATLGIATPISFTDDSCVKLLGADANTYADLLPTTHPSTNYNSVSHEAEYYTIDTEASGNNNSDSVYQAKPLPVQINATQPIVVTDAAVTNSTPAWDSMQDTSVIIVSSAECESDTPVSIAFQDSISGPASIESASKSLQLDNSRRDALVAIAEKPVKKPRRRRPKKDKVYEITEKLADPVLEKKRLNAINAKKNRDRKKYMLRDLGDKVSAVTKERDELRKEVDKLKEREQALRQQLEAKYGVSLPSF